jgi:hypothetical protein
MIFELPQYMSTQMLYFIQGASFVTDNLAGIPNWDLHGDAIKFLSDCR